MAKLFVVAIMIAILFCLGSGLYYLIHDEGKTDRVLKALAWRIGISIALFILLFVAWAAGFIAPHGVGG